MNSDEYNDTESDTEKRAYHNLLERKRRDHIKDSFTSLKEVLPAFKGEKVKASRAQILKKAVDFIQNTTRKNQAHVNDIADLKRENVLLEDQIRTLQEAIETGNLDDIPDFAMGQHLFTSASTSNQVSSSSSESDSEDQDDEDSTDSSEEELPKPRCKRRKVDA